MSNQQMSENFTAIENYIKERIQCELFVLPGASGHMMAIMKGIPAGCIEKVERGEPVELPEHLKNELDLIDPDTEEFVENVNELWETLGKKYPLFILGSASSEGQVVLDTSFSAHFVQTVVLDYSDPKFFGQLDQVIKHVLTHDDLSQFSLQV
jgi:hypothetical protein